MIRVRVLTRIRYQPVYPYPLSAAVSLPLSSSFLGMPKFWMKSIIKEDTVTVISEYTIRPAGIYDRDSTSTDTSVSRYALDMRQPVTLEMTRARASSPAQEAPWRTTRPHPVPMKHPPARAARRGSQPDLEVPGKQFPEPEESGHTYGCEDGGLKEFLAQETKAQGIA